jgi:SAM-dependent methyltransferase
MIRKANEHIIEDGLANRAQTMLADVHRIPLANESVDLVISRGSKPFWKDPAAALREIFRVLALGGKTFVGGGRGTPEIRKQIDARMEAMGISGFRGKSKKGHPPGRRANHNNEEIMKQTGITSYTIVRGDDGTWLNIWK